MKQFVKAWPKTGNYFKYLCKNSSFVGGQIIEGVFFGPDIIKPIFDEDFLFTLTEVEREAWIAFKSVVPDFLRNKKEPEYVTIVANMLENFKVLGCLISLKNSFFEIALGFFPDNFCAVRSTENVSTKILR
jgi:hypothetical protein